MAILIAGFGRAIVLAILVCSAVSGDSEAEEYRLKAAFLYNFAKFVEWPTDAFHSPEEPVAICVIGRNPFGDTLADLVGANTVGARHFVVRGISQISEAAGCHILFVSSSERKRVPAILEALKSASVLTVSDIPNFASQGGAFCLRLENGKVRIAINSATTKEKNLRVSSRLLSLAENVR